MIPKKRDFHLGPLLLTWINFNHSMDKLSHAQWSVEWNYLSISKLQQYNEVWEWIRNFLPHFVMGVMLTKGALALMT